MQRKSRLTLVMMAILLAFGTMGIQPAKPAQAALPTDLFISEYIEGGSFNKAIEIYNGTGSPVDLSDYRLELYTNGAASPSQSVVLSGTLATGDVFVAAHGSAAQPILDQADLLNNSVVNWNGDDAIALRKISTDLLVDVFGQTIGVDPGDYWGTIPVVTADRTLVRKADICAGDPDGSNAFDPATEWDMFPKDTVAYLGSHTSSCAPEIFPERFIISEYIEGSSSNRAIELFNGTGADINLQNYKMVLFPNGSTTPGNTLTWGEETILAEGETYVIANSSAIEAIKNLADTFSTVTYFTGDDALVLFEITPEGDVVQDSFGQRGFDPGTAWGSGSDTATAERTLVRKASVCQGDTFADNVFEPSLEYNGYDQNTYSNLGSHTMTCSGEDLAPIVGITEPAHGGTAFKASDIMITFSEPVTVTGDWFSISCTITGLHTAEVVDEDSIFTLNPDQDFDTSETCTVTVLAANVKDDDEDDTDFDNMVENYTFTFNTIAACGDTFTAIPAIQGVELTSPSVGNVVTTEGVVVGDYQTNAYVSGTKNGFYIQAIEGDGNPATSDGIFVYSYMKDVAVGDHVRVTGTVAEYIPTDYEQSMTQLGSVTQILTCGTEINITPTVLTLPVENALEFESHEGMLVTIPQELILSEYYNFGRYGEIKATNNRFMQFTAVYEPDVDGYSNWVNNYFLNSITLDDGRTGQNPDPAYHPNGEVFTLDNLFRGGDTISNITGVFDHSYDLYRIQPRLELDYFGATATYTSVNTRPEDPGIIEGDLKVVSFNVLNYFVTLDNDPEETYNQLDDLCGPSGGLDCRGADTAEEFERQKAKILAAMAIIDADIFGLMEIENEHTGGANAVADLVDGLNAIAGAGPYAYIVTGAIGTDAIKQAILYKPASVTPVGDYEILDSTVDSRFIDTKNRPVLAQVFMDNATGVEFVVAVNHLKSKGSPCDGDPDTGDGQGNCNNTRTTAAQALVDWLADTDIFPDVEKVLIIGDLNSYDKEDPINAIKLGADDKSGTDDDYLDMIFEKRDEYAYGYVYDGQMGYLDHALANHAMADSIVDVNIWHINADEPSLIDYDMSFKLPAQDALYAPDAYRSSDHDPVIITLSFAPLAVTDVDLLQSIDPLTLETTATPVPGSLATGFTMVLDPAVEYYYLDTDTITSNRALADGSYPFYMTANPGAEFFAYWAERGVVEGATGWQGLMWQIINGDAPMFYLKVAGGTYSLIDGIQGDPNPLRVNGTYFLGDYSFSGDVKDIYGFTDEISLDITFVAPLAVTDVDLLQSTDPLTLETTATPVPGSLATGFTMVLDPAVEYYYLDTDTITSNRALADGSYPFYMTANPGAEFFAYWAERGVVEGATGWQALMWPIINGDAPMFYLKVAGGTYSLIDGIQGDPNPLRVNGTYFLGDYSFSGDVEDIYGFTDEISLDITFVAPLAVTDVDLLQSTDPLTLETTATPVPGSLATGFTMALDPAVEYYYLDTDTITSNRPLGDGSYPFFMTGNPGAEFFAYWAERGVVEGASGWQALMWPIINGDAPMFYLKVEGTSLTLIDGLQGAPNPLRVNGAYYPGLYTFSGLVADEFGFEDELDVSIFFNDMPIAEDQSVTTPEETPIDITLTAMDIEGDPLVYAIAAQPAHGTVTLVGDVATYTPALDFVGEDSFTFTANDGTVDSQIATVTITVTEIKDQVVAVDDFYTMDEDTTLIIAAPGVLANDIDVDNNNQAASLVTGVQHGTLSLLGDGSFTYTPDPDFFGTDTFVYKLITYPAPQSLWTDEATVTITINPIGDAPVLGMIEDATIPELVEFSFTATATDVDLPAQVLTFSLVGAPEGAAITPEGVFTWTPSELQGPGEFTFTVMVCDDTAPTALCDEQEITLAVTEVNTAPVADDLTATTAEETLVDITLVASDVEDDPLTYTIIDQPTHGSVTLLGNIATYTPELNYYGVDSFTYKANDGLVDSEMAVVIITVTPVNDAPVAVGEIYTTDEDVALTVLVADGVLANDTDVDGDTLSAIMVNNVVNGTLVLAGDGSFVYTPAENFFGLDSFTYKASDGTLESWTVTVTIVIDPVNDYVEANDDEYETMAGVTLEVAAPGVLDNDVLLDPNETVTLEVLVQPAGGTLTLNDDGSFTYVPNAGFFGVDTFEYQLNSLSMLNGEFSDTAIVTIKLTARQLFLPLILR